MRNRVRSYLLSFIFVLASHANAAVPFCTPLTVQDKGANVKTITLPGPVLPKTAQIYFFKNIATQGVWLDHPVVHPSASAGWSSYLRVGHSSALVVNRKNFSISCAIIHPGKVEYLNCAKVVAVCVSTQPAMPAGSKGTYWLIEDKPWDELTKVIVKRNKSGSK